MMIILGTVPKMSSARFGHDISPLILGQEIVMKMAIEQRRRMHSYPTPVMEGWIMGYGVHFLGIPANISE
jgi:hypothetical protein